MELGITSWRALPAAAVLCWQTAIGTGGEDCCAQISGTGASSLVVEKIAAFNNVTGDIAVQIESLKEALRLSYAEVGKIFGVSRQTVYNWLKGENIQAAHQTKLSSVMQSFADIRKTLTGRKEFFNERALVGEKNLVQLLAEDRFDAFHLLQSLLLQSDQRVALLRQHLSGNDSETIPSHFDPLD